MRIRIFSCAAVLVLCGASFLSATEENLLKKWNTVPAKDVTASQAAGYQTSLKMNRSILTPEGNPSMELAILQTPQNGDELGLVLKFNYTANFLKGGLEYEIAFSYRASATCQALAAVGLGGNPSWDEFPHGRRILSFSEEWKTVKIPFIMPRDEAPPINLPRIMCGKLPAGTKLYFSEVTLIRKPRKLTMKLNPEWELFQPTSGLDSFLGGEMEKTIYSDIPKEILGCPPRKVVLKDGVLDLGGDIREFHPRQTAYLYNRFESEEAGEMHIGLSADWWFALYVNGHLIYDTCAAGNRSKKFVPDDHVVAIPVKKGTNVLAVRLLSGSAGWKFICAVPSAAPVNLESFTLKEDENWRKIHVPYSVDKGSVLDFSQLGFLDAPAGKYGRVIVNNGHFAFADRPDTPVRFYGTNIYDAICYQDREGAERLADTLAAYGYNALRIHHYDRNLVCHPESGWTDLDPGKLDQLNYLVKCLKAKGIYLLIDLHTTRLGLLNRQGMMSILHEPEMRRNWERFAANLMNTPNPYTGIAWKYEPSLIGICPVNENSPIFFAGNSGAVKSEYQNFPEGLSPEEKQRAFVKFVVESQKRHYPEVKTFLRKLGVQAPLTDQNVSSTVAMALMRNACDYVDNHFYWAHVNSTRGTEAKYIQSVPVDSAMQSFIGSQSGFYLPDAFAARILGKPYMISEFNFCAANPYRAEGGALVGAYAALQDWDALFRFGFAAHPGQIQHEWHTVGFDTVGDPMKYLSDRLGILLFLRKDVRPAKEVLPIAVPENYTDSQSKWFSARIGGLYSPALSHWGFVSRIGSVVGESGPFPADLEEPFDTTIGKIRSYLGTRSGSIDMARLLAISTTGELTLDGRKGTFLIDTPRTAAVVSAKDGKYSAGPLTADIRRGFALVSASSLEETPLADSGRILLFHLTNVQNFAQRFTDSTMAVMESWGEVPHVVRRGTAGIQLVLAPGAEPVVYGIDLNGRRIGKIPSQFDPPSGRLNFTADTFALQMPCMVYEIVRSAR